MNVATSTGNVGIRELRDHLSKYLAQVKEGREVLVTDHGKPIARLVPPDPSQKRLARLIAEGRVTPPKRNDRRPLPPPIKIEGGIQDILRDQRRR